TGHGRGRGRWRGAGIGELTLNQACNPVSAGAGHVNVAFAPRAQVSTARAEVAAYQPAAAITIANVSGHTRPATKRNCGASRYASDRCSPRRLVCARTTDHSARNAPMTRSQARLATTRVTTTSDPYQASRPSTAALSRTIPTVSQLRESRNTRTSPITSTASATRAQPFPAAQMSPAPPTAGVG